MVDTAARPDYKPALSGLGQGSAQVAQLVEHATENRSVGGSIPPLGTINPLSDLHKIPLALSVIFSEGRRCNPIATLRRKTANAGVSKG